MTTILAETWVYVVVQNPGKNEEILGLHDTENDIQYIPAFNAKETATLSLGRLVKTRGTSYEIQAILFEDLQQFVSRSNFFIFFLDEDGRVLSKYAPDGRPL